MYRLWFFYLYPLPEHCFLKFSDVYERNICVIYSKYLSLYYFKMPLCSIKMKKFGETLFISDVLTWPVMWHCSTLSSCTVIVTERHNEVIFKKEDAFCENKDLQWMGSGWKTTEFFLKKLFPSSHDSYCSLETHSHTEMSLKSFLVKEILDQTNSDSLVNESLFRCSRYCKLNNIPLHYVLHFKAITIM